MINALVTLLLLLPVALVGLAVTAGLHTTASTPLGVAPTPTIDPRLIVQPRTVTQTVHVGDLAATLVASPLYPGPNQLQITLRERGRPLSGARVRIAARMVAMVMQPVTANAAQARAGHYAAVALLHSFGQWRLIVDVDGPHGPARAFAFSLSLDLPPALAAALAPGTPVPRAGSPSPSSAPSLPPGRAPTVRTNGAWQRQGPNTLARTIISDPSRPSLLYAATTDGVLRSDDTGATWQFRNAGLPLSSRVLWDIRAFDHGRLAVATADGHVYLSADGGSHWHDGATVGADSIYALAADPLHAATLLAGGDGGIWRTQDGGAHWERVYRAGNAGVASFSWSDADPSHVYAGLVPGSHPVIVSTDAGVTWRPFGAGFAGQLGVMALLRLSGNTGGMLAGTMGGATWRLDTRAATWRASRSGLPPLSHGAALLADPAAPHRIWVGTLGSGVFSSLDDGRTWEQYGPPLPGNAGIVLALAFAGHRLLAGTATGIYALDLPG